MQEFSYNKLIEFNSGAKQFYKTAKDETDFSKSLDRACELIKPYFEDKGGYNERANKINRSTAAKDEKRKGILLTDDYGRFLYTSAGLERRDDLMNELGEEKIELDFQYCDGDIPEMSLEMQKIFKGIVINPEPKEKEVPALTIVE